jgi:hypothetical protein
MFRKQELEPQATSIPSLPSKDTEVEHRLEKYLDEVCASFWRELPEEKRNELRAEMRVHLDERVAAHLELGDTAEEAIARTLEQFGKSKKVGRAWRRERIAAALAGGASAKQASCIALALYTPTCLLGLYLIQVETTIILGMAAGYMSPQTLQIVNLLAYATSFLLPIPAGILIGMLTRERAVCTSLKSLCFLSLPMIVVHACRPPFNQSMAQGGCAMLLFMGLFWIPIGCASAGIGGWLRKHTTRRRQRLTVH